MNPTSAKRLAKLLRAKRLELGISASEVGRRSGVDPATITRIERAQIPTPRADSLTAIAQVLDISMTDLFVAADWLPKGELPSWNLYLRSKFGDDLSDEALQELYATFSRIVGHNGNGGKGPQAGEDEI